MALPPALPPRPECRGLRARFPMTSAYRIELEPDDNGTFLVTCPDLPGNP
jgi:hypothetical protein